MPPPPILCLFKQSSGLLKIAAFGTIAAKALQTNGAFQTNGALNPNEAPGALQTIGALNPNEASAVKNFFDKIEVVQTTYGLQPTDEYFKIKKEFE